ncbi:GIY-YIG nuclease family protein [Candidatus Kuenenia sp.]|uniref:GIY-YIG nuclease family protein n=1 Tax=Candidatus Kuenenia sp. TaxID=2499824 RepID=UPI0032208633
MCFSVKKGIYCLIIKLFQEREIPIGKLGTFHFPAGFYVYVGSAQNNLRLRIERHLRQTKNNRWHIDYLLDYGQIITVYSYAKDKSLECVLGRKIASLPKAIFPVKGFGSSDCSCITHLYFFPDNPSGALASFKGKFALPERRHYNTNGEDKRHSK